MKKSLLVILVLFIIFIPTSVKAEEFVLDNYIQNEYISKLENGSYKTEQFRQVKLKGDTLAVYVFDLWSNYDDNFTLSEINIKSFNKDLLRKINLISYFGYGFYKRHDIKWYIVTQFMILREIDSSYSFSDSNGNRIKKYESEIKEIENSINLLGVLPSFANQTYHVNKDEKLVLKDTNNVYMNYVITSGGVGINHSSNSNLYTIGPITKNISILFNNLVNYNLFQRSLLFNNGKSYLYIPGNELKDSFCVVIYLASGNVNIRILNKEDSKFYDILADTKIKLRNIDNGIETIAEVDVNGEINLMNFPYGTYDVVDITDNNLIKMSNTRIVISSNNYNFILYKDISLIEKNNTEELEEIIEEEYKEIEDKEELINDEIETIKVDNNEKEIDIFEADKEVIEDINSLIIEVPNTYIKEKNYKIIYIVLIVSGLILINRNNYEKNKINS